MAGSTDDHKIFNDPIHGHISLHPACVAIVDTQQFQRLRYIKQLGVCYYVYPGASHNRFEHSIGVCYLAGQLLRSIKDNQPKLVDAIRDKDILCVEIAGLCHDLGHGPFSHLFDQKFMPAATGREWKHEDASALMFDYLIEKNKLMKDDGVLKKYGLDAQDIKFIKEQIVGPPAGIEGEWQMEGRPKEKGFLYEVVANKRNGIDVDKWDYFARDCHHLGIANSFDHARVMKFARVLQDKGNWQICVRDNLIDDIYQMFLTRYRLHCCAYQHKVNCAIDLMMTDALVAANEECLVRGKRMSDCVGDMAYYMHLNDGILHKILDSDSDSDEMKRSREILQRIWERDLYICVGESKSIVPGGRKWDVTVIKEQLQKILSEGMSVSVPLADFCVQVAKWNFGMKERNPIKTLKVYCKSEPDKAVDAPEPGLLIKPSVFEEIKIRVYSCTKDDAKRRSIREAFQRWLQDEGLCDS